MREFLTEQEAAGLARVAPKTLRNMRCTGGGPAFIKVGGGSRVVYDAADIEGWLDAQKVRSTSEATERRRGAEGVRA
jgi:hypothetical protein